jgi:hypothetical protein
MTIRSVLVAAVCALGLLVAAPAQAAAPHNTSRPKVKGHVTVGKKLRATVGKWRGHPRTYRFRWLRCNRAGAHCRAIKRARSRRYVVRKRDAGHRLRVKVTAKNRSGKRSKRSRRTRIVRRGRAGGNPTPPPAPGAAGLHVVGNRLMDGSAPVHLHGVNKSGTEYACVQGWGIFDGPTDDASIAAMRAWNINVVHMGLNEDCILGINGVPARYSGANYMNAIVDYVNRLHAHGMYAEISLMWAAPGNEQATDHPPILDADHSPAALRAIANAFKGDPNTFIGLQSEPHDISWACWKNGGSSCDVGYEALGMQAALDAVRSTGAANVVTASGIDYSNNLGQWLQNKPADPLGQLMAEAHIYGGNVCDDTACFDRTLGPVVAQVPLVLGETGETFDGSSCGASNIAAILRWADAHNVGYEAWTWNTWGNCSALISDDDGTPNSAYARFVRNHYTSL